MDDPAELTVMHEREAWGAGVGGARRGRQRGQGLITAALLLLAFGATGCRLPSFGGNGCSEVGCLDGLIVQFQGSLPDVYTVEAMLPGGVLRAVTCEWDRFNGGGSLLRQENSDAGAMCLLDGVRFGGVAPEEVTLTVTVDSNTPTTETVQPVIDRSFPNGPDCPPECVTALVQLIV